VRFTIFRTATVERYYKCSRCETRATTLVRAKGSASYRRGLIEDGELEAREESQINLQDDATRILSLVRCPHCQLRERGAIGYSIARGVFSLIGATVLGAFVALMVVWAWEWPFALIYAIGALTLFGGLSNEFRRWGEAGRARARLVDVRPGSPAATLPRAIALPKLPPPPPEPIKPVASVEPEHEQPVADDGAGPRFLR
jgi:hypothetical protein